MVGGVPPPHIRPAPPSVHFAVRIPRSRGKDRPGEGGTRDPPPVRPVPPSPFRTGDLPRVPGDRPLAGEGRRCQAADRVLRPSVPDRNAEAGPLRDPPRI